MTEPGIGIGRRLGYALCNVGVALGTVPTTILLLYYLTEIVGLRAGLAGLVVALPKIWDALVDPMFGGWVDQLSMRIGRRAPVILISGAGFLVSLVLIFSLPEMHSSGEILVIAVLLLIVSSISQTALGVSQYALATEMTGNSVVLSGILSLAAIVGQVFNVLGSIVAPMLISWSGDGAAGYSRMALEIAAISGLAILIFVAATRRVPISVKAPDSEGMSLWASLRATGANHAYYYIIAFVLCVNASAAVLFGFLPFANQYVLGGDQGSLSVLEGVLGGTVLAGMAMSPLFVRWFGAIPAMRLCNWAVVAMAGLLFVASFGPLCTTWAAIGGIGIGSGIIGVLVQTATLKAARLKLDGAVVVALGFYLGIMVSGIKIGASIGGFASGELLDVIGFVRGGAPQSAGTLLGLRIGYTLVPMLFLLAGGFCLHRVRMPADEPPAVT